jgi:arylsulfatase A
MGRLNRREFLRAIGLTAAGMTIPACRSAMSVSAAEGKKRPPNFIIIFIDDMGYADVGCFGAEGYQTPNIDRMAAEGMRCTDFYAAAPVCTPSRAALMTGCYPQRVGLPNVLGPKSQIGIGDSEMTIAQVLKPLGYATACFGKWHLGHLPQFLPTHHGFDEYFGLPYSNDMWPKHPEAPQNYPDLPLVEGDRTIALNPDQTQLTTWYTERAVRFIEKNQGRLFFLYVPHSMVHVPLHVSDKFKGKSKKGLFGDVVMEVDWSVGQILDTLRRLHLDKDTMVLFCSDNGPWLSYGEHAGSAKPLREGKATTFDGGQREPTIFWWPDHIPAGKVCREPATSRTPSCPTTRSTARTSGPWSAAGAAQRVRTKPSITTTPGPCRRSAAAAGSCTSRTPTTRWRVVPAVPAASPPSTSRPRSAWPCLIWRTTSASSTTSPTSIRTS